MIYDLFVMFAWVNKNSGITIMELWDALLYVFQNLWYGQVITSNKSLFLLNWMS